MNSHLPILNAGIAAFCRTHGKPANDAPRCVEPVAAA